MAKHVSDLSKHVAATANRLRLIQIDFADESTETRRGYLSEEIGRALDQVVPDQRQAFLTELLTRFPTWDPSVVASRAEEEVVARSEFDERELQDASFLVTRLTALAPSLSDSERQAVTERLREAGLAPRSEGGWPEEGVKRLRETLQVGSDATLDPDRVLELAALVADFAASLDQLVWRAWQRLAPKSTFRSTTPLRGTFSQFASGDQGTPRGQVVHDIRRLRQLVAALVSACGMAGQFATRYVARFSPSEIETLVSMEGGGFFVAKEVKCWRRYAEMATEVNEASIEQDIRQQVAEFVESLMRGLRR